MRSPKSTRQCLRRPLLSKDWRRLCEKTERTSLKNQNSMELEYMYIYIYYIYKCLYTWTPETHMYTYIWHTRSVWDQLILSRTPSFDVLMYWDSYPYQMIVKVLRYCPKSIQKPSPRTGRVYLNLGCFQVPTSSTFLCSGVLESSVRPSEHWNHMKTTWFHCTGFFKLTSLECSQ